MVQTDLRDEETLPIIGGAYLVAIVEDLFYRVRIASLYPAKNKKKSDYFFRRYLACYNTYIKFNQK